MLAAGILLALLAAIGQAPQAGAPVAEPPHARGWDDFPVFVWREEYAGKPLPEELAEPFGGVILMREEDSSWARERGLSYLVWNVAGRDALHLDADEAWNARVERWIETHDEKLLVREPCLNDPKTIEKLFATLDTTIARHGEHPGLGFVLGDEVGLTPNGDPFDLCRCPLCEAKWKQYAQENGLPERAPLTDEVRLSLLDDDFSTLGAWLARRQFDRSETLHLVLRLRERALDRPDPGEQKRYKKLIGDKLPVGLLGIGGTTAFGGMDMSWPMSFFDFIECYPALDARESLSGLKWRAAADPSFSTLATIFVADETPDGSAWRAWEHWLRGGQGLVLWSDAALEDRPEHLARLVDAVRDIRTLSCEHGIRPRVAQNGGAIVFDSYSVCTSFLRDALLDGPTWPRRKAGYQAEHGTRERKVKSWLRWIEDCGILPTSIDLRFDLPSRRKYFADELGFLVLPEILVVSDEDVRNLEEFVAEGGTIFVDGQFGWVDLRGLPRKQDLFERLRSIAPERVQRAPPELESYLEAGTDPDHPRTLTAAQKGLVELLAAQREKRQGRRSLRLSPDLGPEAAMVPWLVAHPSDHLVMLPNLPTPEERRALRPIQLVAPKGMTWVHPPTDACLRPGDAAVLRLH